MNTDNHVIIYNAEDGQTKIEVKLQNETVWLTQVALAELFQTSKNNISQHVKNIFEEGELDQNATVKKFLTVQKEGNRTVKRELEYYNLDLIISVGYRIKSLIATAFRQWATARLREYIVKGFVMDDERLESGTVAKTYFQEWEERIRKIRTSEANFYQKVRDVFATSVDYNPKADHAQTFFATVQNKFHFAITGLTAAEIVVSRIHSTKKSLGLTNWKGKIITREQAEVAKNYLEELELKRLNLLVEQFLSFAELQSVEQRVMYMRNWMKKLDGFLILNDKEILDTAGSMSRKDMEQKVRQELAVFNQKQLK